MKAPQIQFYDINVLPRAIPFGLKLKIVFGSMFTFMGIIFFIPGVIIFSIFFKDLEIGKISLQENDPIVNAKIIAIEETNSRINKKNVYAYLFNFNDKNGNLFTGKSFSTSSLVQVNDTVPIQYALKDPMVSCVVAMSSTEMPKFFFIMMGIFPLIGFLFLIGGIRWSIKSLKLIKNGIYTSGTVLRKEPTNTKINKQTVYKVYFEFKAQDGLKYTSFVKSHKTYYMGDEELEPLVYDSKNPNRAMLIDALPKQVRNFFNELLS